MTISPILLSPVISNDAFYTAVGGEGSEGGGHRGQKRRR